MTVEELRDRLQTSDAPFLLDVREPGEFAGGAIAGAVNLPMGQVERRIAEVPKDRDVAVICHSGARSAMVTRKLAGLGYARATNVSGGMSAWSRRIDTSVPAGGFSTLFKALFGGNAKPR